MAKLAAWRYQIDALGKGPLCPRCQCVETVHDRQGRLYRKCNVGCGVKADLLTGLLDAYGLRASDVGEHRGPVVDALHGCPGRLRGDAALRGRR